MVDAGTAAIAAAAITQLGGAAALVLLNRRVAAVHSEVRAPDAEDGQTTGEAVRQMRDDLIDMRRDVAGVGVALGQHLFDHDQRSPRRRAT
jgi:hypothetical protein